MSICKFTVTLCLIQSALWYLFAKVLEIFSLSILKMIRKLIFVLPKIEKMLYLKEQINPSSLWDFNVTVSVTKPEFLAVPE